jgi:F0F1-type ATP synthase gamma subunit
MYIISKFESFSNQPDIEEIKDIFQELVDKWDMVKNSRDSKDIKYSFNIDDKIIDYHRLINIGKEIENIENVYLIIHCDLSGPNDFYTTLYEFNNDCEDLLKRFQYEFNCQLLTAYGNQYLQSKGIGTSRFVFVFYRN